jgi:hypothetical protein
MANKKISQLTPKGSALAGTDLLEVSVFNGATYDTKSLTGANVVSGLQPTLFSGTNIKTINSTSLLGSGDIAISTGLTVGTTAIASGTVGRVLFQGTGNVVQEDSALFWDNTNKRLGVGATPATDVRLDVRAQGTLVTDIAFRVRNSADTANIVTIQGDGAFTVGTYTSPNTKLSVTGTSFGAYITGNTGIYAQCNTTSGTLYAIDCLGRASSGANTSYGIRATSDTTGVGSNNYGGRFVASNGTTNYAGYFDAYGGTNNYALVTQRGFSGFNKIDPSAIVDIKAAGALSTDIALRVRNSANTFNTLNVKGNGTVDIVAGSTSGSLKALDVRYATDTLSLLSVRGDGAVYFANDLSYFNPNTFRFNIEGAGIVNGTTSINLLATSGDVILSPSNAEKFRISSTVATFAEGIGIATGTATGTKIGTATTQKIGFWNATPIVQPTTAVASATVVSGSGGNVKHDDTFDGYTLEKVVKALRNTGLLA